MGYITRARKTNKRPRTYSGTHRRDFYNKSNAEMIGRICDLKISIEDMEELEKIDHRQARMLERGTGKLRKCKNCGEVFVNDGKNERMFGTWINRNGFTCFFCRKGFRVNYKKDSVAKKKREIMQRVWELYIQRVNLGVKTTKNANSNPQGNS